MTTSRGASTRRAARASCPRKPFWSIRVCSQVRGAFVWENSDQCHTEKSCRLLPAEENQPGLSSFETARRQIRFALEYLDLARIHPPSEGNASIKVRPNRCFLGFIGRGGI
jgi:hypothetical protein